MSKLEQIGVRIETTDAPSQVPAMLIELQSKLHELVQHARSDTIALRSLPLFPGDLELLRETLGYGEIHVSLDAMGPSEIYETAIPGIWWTTHYNSAEEVIAEFIEITTLPEILKTSDEELRQAEQKLQELLTQFRQLLNT